VPSSALRASPGDPPDERVQHQGGLSYDGRELFGFKGGPHELADGGTYGHSNRCEREKQADRDYLKEMQSMEFGNAKKDKTHNGNRPLGEARSCHAPVPTDGVYDVNESGRSIKGEEDV
jgi:hypothetical protein